MAIQLIAPATNKNAETLALIQALGQTAGQGVAGYVAGQDRQKKQQGEQAVLASLMQGQPGQMGAGGMGPPTAGTPGLSEQEAMAALMSGAAPDIIAQRYKPAEQMTPYQAAQIDIARQGVDLNRQGMALDQQGMQLRRDQFASDQEYQRAKLELERQGLAQAGAGESAVRIGDIRNARLDYMDVSAPFMDLSANYQKLDSALSSGTGEGDIAAIFSFMKSLDPASTVREGEAASAQNSSGALQGLWNYYNQVLGGERLSDPQRQNFRNVAGNWLQQARDRQLTYEQQHREQAELAGIDPARVVPDVIGSYREWTAPPPGGATPLQEAGQGITDAIVEGAQSIIGGPPPAAAQPGGAPAAPGAPAQGYPGSPAAPMPGVPSASPPPNPGDIEDGYRFRGGDWRDPANWERVQEPTQ
ncbi:MAG: hypothetical protein AB7O44_27400 [Hyphomicrobiaceae bacterium]